MPYRIDESGEVRVLLITTRETRRWVIPKGNLIYGLAAHEAAAQEAFEEAGVAGVAATHPIGYYSYWKRRRSGALRRAKVAVFPLAVNDQAASWPEQHQRRTQWLIPGDAAAAIAEPDLAAMVRAFHLPPDQVKLKSGWSGKAGAIGRWFRARTGG